MATLTGKKIKNTYDALLKLSDNDNLTTTAKQVTDGFGNNAPLFISTTQIGIGVTPETGYDLHVYSDAKVGGNLTITGDLTVNGTTTTVDTDTLRVEDPLIELARLNTSADSVDIGFYGKYHPSATTLYSGLFRDAGDDKFKLFKSLQEEPTTTVNTSGTGYTKADLVIGGLEATGGNFTGIVYVDTHLEVENSSGFGFLEVGGSSGAYIDLKSPFSDDFDLRLYTAGTNAQINALNGELDITANTNINLQYQGTDVLTIESSRVLFSQQAVFGNDIKALFGGSSDLQIYHSATGDSYIANNTGDLIINSSGITGTAIKDEDNMASDSASHLATQQSIKAYVDNQVTLQDLDITDGTNNGSVDLDSQVLTFTQTANETTVEVDGQEVTFGLPSSISVDVTGDLTGDVYNADGSIILNTGDNSIDAVLSDGVRATTQSQNDNSTKLATTAYVDAAIGANDTLAEILANGNTSGANDIIMTDDQSIHFGDDSDLSIEFNSVGNFGRLNQKTGHLYLQNSADDSDIHLRSDDGTGGVTTYFFLDGSEADGTYVYTNFPDNSILNFGNATNGDLQIYHDAANSYIKDKGTGSLILAGNRIEIKNAANDEHIAEFIQNGAVELYYDNSKKFETTSTGVSVTGEVYIDGTGNWSLKSDVISGNLVLKDETNNADRVDFHPDGQVEILYAGVATTPSLIFNNDINTGIFHPSNDNLAFATAGWERMRIDSSGTTKITARKAYGSETATLRVATSPTGTNYSDGAFSNIVFGDETIANSHLGEIQVNQIDASASTASDMRFFTNSGGGNTATEERMRIDSSGLARFTVDSGTASAIDIGYVSSARTIRAVETGGGNARPLTLLAQNFTFKDDSATRMTIDSNGALGLGTTPPTTNTHPQLFIGSESVILGSSSGALDIGNNLYYNSGWKHRTTGAGSLLDFDASGNFKFYIASSAAADSAATLSERMQLTDDGGGTFNIIKAKQGTYSSIAALSLYGTNPSANGGSVVSRSTISSQTDGTAFGANLVFSTNDTSNVEQQRFRIASNGDVYNYQSQNKANTYYGYFAGNYGGTGASNTAMGYDALTNVSTGTSNSAIGRNAGNAITTGQSNTVIGNGAGDAITTGSSNTALGQVALSSATTVSGNTAIGRASQQLGTGSSNTSVGNDSLENVTGSNNTAVGYAAGIAVTSGANNVLLGFQSGDTITSGASNVIVGSQAAGASVNATGMTLIGYQAGYDHQADYQTAVGYQALYNSGTGADNVAMGYRALHTLTSGNYNTAVGYSSGLNISTGGQNTLMGYRSFKSLTTGIYNTGFGYETGRDITTTSYNTFVGGLAGLSNTGQNNTFLGAIAGRYATSGQRNTIVGSQAVDNNTMTANDNTVVGFTGGQDLTSGANNTYIGSNSGLNCTTGEGQVGLGYGTLSACTTGSGNIAIGKNAGDNLTTGGSNTLIGYSAGAGGTLTGTANLAVGDAAGYELTSGGNNILIGKNAGRNATTTNSLGIVTTGSNEIQMGNSDHTAAYIQIGWTTVSDARDKGQIKDIPHGLDFVNQLQPKSFEFKPDREAEETDGIERYGFLAQDVLELEGDSPVVVNKNDEDKLKMTNDYLVPILVNAIKELKQEIEILKSQINN